jgi:hypothetical protein
MTEVIDAEIIDQSGALVVAAPAAIVSADPTAVVAAFARYKEIQSALDRAMPDCIMNIRGKQFRKKMYWRAIATAFNLSLELVREEPVQDDEKGGDWGWLVTYRAIAPNGRHADGDGSCYASEKSSGQDSVHNVRAHAHTRAKNRAVADLVGFGEVSAEEMPFDDGATAPPAPAQRSTPARASKGAPPARNDDVPDATAQAFLFQPGDPEPFQPKWRQWRADRVTQNPKSEFASVSWDELAKGSHGGKRYQWARRVLAMPNPPATTAERAKCVVYEIEMREHNRRADMAAATGGETPF